MRSNQPRSARSIGAGSRDQRLLLCHTHSQSVRSRKPLIKSRVCTSGGFLTPHADCRRTVNAQRCPEAHDLWSDIGRADTGVYGDPCYRSDVSRTRGFTGDDRCKGPYMASNCELDCAASQLTHVGVVTIRDVQLACLSFRHGHDRRLQGLIVAVVDGAPGIGPGGRRADGHHHGSGGEHHD